MSDTEQLIREYLNTVPDKKIVVSLSWVKDLADLGSGVDHFTVGFVKDDVRYTDTVVVKDGVKPVWGDVVCIEANEGTHPFITVCKDCENCACDKGECTKTEDATDEVAEEAQA